MEQVLSKVTPYKENLAKEIIFYIVLGVFAVGFLTLGILALVIYQSWVRGIMFTLFFPILLYFIISGLINRYKTKKWINNNIDKPQVVLINNTLLRFYDRTTIEINIKSIYQIGYDKSSVTILLNYYNPKTHNGSPKTYTFYNISEPIKVCEEVMKHIKPKENMVNKD